MKRIFCDIGVKNSMLERGEEMLLIGKERRRMDFEVIKGLVIKRIRDEGGVRSKKKSWVFMR